MPEGIDDLFDGMADDDHENRISSLAEVITRLEKILGQGDSLNRAEIFLTAPFELPEQPQFTPQAPKNQESAGLQEPVLDEKQTQNVGDMLHASLHDMESRGLETINSSLLEQETPTGQENTEAETEDGVAESEEFSGLEGTEDAAAVDQPKAEPLPSVEASSTLDRRETTEVIGPDSTSVLDSIIED